MLSKNKDWVLYENLLKDKDGRAITVPCSSLESRWLQARHIYSFDAEFIENLNERALAHDKNYECDRPVITGVPTISL